MTVQEAAQLAPMATATVALTAVVVATIGIAVQRIIARKRAAVDIFLKTEMDKHLVEAWDALELAVVELRAASSVESFCSESRYKEHYLNMRRYLSIHELIAVGIKNRMFDEGICFDFWGDAIERHFKSTCDVIEYIRRQPHHLTPFLEFERLSLRWIARRAKLQAATT